jgi:hypothetical protein
MSRIQKKLKRLTINLKTQIIQFKNRSNNEIVLKRGHTNGQQTYEKIAQSH